MITLTDQTAQLIKDEMEAIPEKYQKPFNSTHEGLAVLREEYVELENEIFFGEKKARRDAVSGMNLTTDQFELINASASKIHKKRLRSEAIQVAAMACRIIQELT